MTINIERTALEIALHNALIAVSKDRARPILEGAAFEITVVERTGEQRWLEFSVTATDSFRLVSTSINLGHAVKALPRRIIVGNIKGMLAAVKKMGGDSISITINDDRDEIELREDYSTTWQDRPTFWSPIIEGDYPKWRRVVPTLGDTNPGCPPPAFHPADLSDVGKLRHPSMDGTSVKHVRDSKMALVNRYGDPLTSTIWHFTQDHHAKLEAFMLLMPVKYEVAE